MKYQALAVGLPDTLFSGICSLLSTCIHITPSLTVQDATRLLEQRIFHLFIVDLKYLRSVHRSSWLTGIRRISFAPIVVLSETPEQDLHPMVELGADICVSSKYPHSMIADLICAQLRRYTEYNHYDSPGCLEGSPFQVGDIFIDPPRRIVKVQGTFVKLRPREFSLLLYFMKNPNIVLSPEQICHHAWEMTNGYDSGISHPIYLLRKQIDLLPDSHSHIQTVHGFGYRFTPNFVETCDMCEDNVMDLS